MGDSRGVPGVRRRTLLGSRAFTLVEILVVIAIVAALIAIIVPVVAGAKKRSHMAVDISNMRQLATAIAMYREDHEYAPYRLHDLDGVYVTSQEIYVSPADTIQPWGWFACMASGTPDEVIGQVWSLGGIGSYAYVEGCGELGITGLEAPFPDLYARSVEEPTWGILACPVYMRYRTLGVEPATMIDPDGRRVRVPVIDWRQGLLLCMAADGSLRKVQWPRDPKEKVLPHHFLMEGPLEFAP